MDEVISINYADILAIPCPRCLVGAHVKCMKLKRPDEAAPFPHAGRFSEAIARKRERRVLDDGAADATPSPQKELRRRAAAVRNGRGKG